MSVVRLQTRNVWLENRKCLDTYVDSCWQTHFDSKPHSNLASQPPRYRCPSAESATRQPFCRSLPSPWWRHRVVQELPATRALAGLSGLRPSDAPAPDWSWRPNVFRFLQSFCILLTKASKILVILDDGVLPLQFPSHQQRWALGKNGCGTRDFWRHTNTQNVTDTTVSIWTFSQRAKETPNKW